MRRVVGLAVVVVVLVWGGGAISRRCQSQVAIGKNSRVTVK